MAFFNLFKTKSKLGIDIGTASIKIMELENKNSRFELLNYGMFELKNFNKENESSSGQNILRLPESEIVWGIKEAMKRAGIKSKDVIASIPSFSTFATTISMPYLSEEDLAKAMPIEAKKYIPIPISDVIIDWSIIDIKDKSGNVVADKTILSKATKDKKEKPTESISEDSPTSVEIFLAAVPKNETAKYQNIMKAAGLNLRALELENSALIRSLLGNDLSPTAIINIGGRSTSIMIVDKGYERSSHNYEIGGFEITKSIARSLNIGLDKAEELKKQFGLRQSDENIINEAMISLVDMMVFEAKKTVTNYEEANNKRIPRIVITGGLTNMPNFMNYFKQKIGREVFVGNIFSRVVYNKDLEPIIGELSNVFAVANGLAMRNI